MDKGWSEKNKKMQELISKEATFAEGIKLLIELRAELFEQITSIVKTFPAVAFYQMPLVPVKVRIAQLLPGHSGILLELKILLHMN